MRSVQSKTHKNSFSDANVYHNKTNTFLSGDNLNSQKFQYVSIRTNMHVYTKIFSQHSFQDLKIRSHLKGAQKLTFLILRHIHSSSNIFGISLDSLVETSNRAILFSSHSELSILFHNKNFFFNLSKEPTLRTPLTPRSIFLRLQTFC